VTDSSVVGGRSRNLVLAAMIFAVSMTFIDQTIVSIAAPKIQRELGLSATGVQWAINAYLLSLAALFAFGGRLADTVGHRKMVTLGVVVFAGASAFCATDCWAAPFGAKNFKATNIPTVTSRRAAAPNPATRNQIRFDADALDGIGGGSWRSESRERLGCVDGAGPVDARDSAGGTFRELFAGLRAGGSTSCTSEVEASIGLRPIRGTAIRSEHLGQRTVFPASSSATRILWPALQVNSIPIAASGLDRDQHLRTTMSVAF